MSKGLLEDTHIYRKLKILGVWQCLLDGEIKEQQAGRINHAVSFQEKDNELML